MCNMYELILLTKLKICNKLKIIEQLFNLKGGLCITIK